MGTQNEPDMSKTRPRLHILVDAPANSVVSLSKKNSECDGICLGNITGKRRIASFISDPMLILILREICRASP